MAPFTAASARAWLAAALVPLAWASAACSGGTSPAGSGSFPADPYTTMTSDSGALVVDVRTSPQPPSRGTIEVQLTVTKAGDGTPVDGLSLAVEPWMPAMGHGTSTPTVAPQGGGVYLVTEVYLYMPGVWELRTTLAGATTDHATAQLTIP
jgi:hypothetical protein